MNPRGEKTLLSQIRPDRLIGRLDQIGRVYLHAVSGAEPYSLRVVGPPGAGTSEILRQVYDRLFREQRFVVPFYFALRPADATGEDAAVRYAYQFLLQAIAFRRKEPELLAATPDICELSKLAPLADADWVARMCEVCRIEGPLNDSRAFIRSALAGPLRAAAAGKMRVCVMIDDLHVSAALDGGQIFLDELSAVAATARTSFIFAGRRRFVVPGQQTLEIGRLTRDDAATLVETLADDAGVRISEQTRDLIAVQFGGDPSTINSFVGAAREKHRQLGSYRDVEQLYAEELLTGRIALHFDQVFTRAAPEPGSRRELIESLHFAEGPEGRNFPLGALRDRLDLHGDEFRRLVESLELDEIVKVDTATARLSSNDPLRDFLDTRYRLDNAREPAAAVAASVVTNALKRAPRLMARVYRREASAGLQDLLLMFDIQDVPRGLIDYRVFRDRYKGTSDEAVRGKLGDEKEFVTLPQISHAVPLADYFLEFGEPVEPERAIVGVGFADRTYRDEDQIVWLAAEIDSKLEADHALTLEWCDRLDGAARSCGFSSYRIWLVAPEGFSDGALDLLSEKNAVGSCRRQVDLLRTFLSGETAETRSRAAEYEMVIPVGEDTELIAAHALEEIARRYSFPAKAVNQIKTALVEACINAAEHSLSPDRKVYQKFAVDDEKIVVTVSNRGIRLTDKLLSQTAAEPAHPEGRRGWGLNLMRSLMDEVRLESVDDGTRIVMTKYIRSE
jgi:serine/threonine-protein kinase RsbW